MLLDIVLASVLLFLIQPVQLQTDFFPTNLNSPEFATNATDSPNVTSSTPRSPSGDIGSNDDSPHCPTDPSCSSRLSKCIECRQNANCRYGTTVNVQCRCTTEERVFNRTAICSFCHQLNSTQYTCSNDSNCNAVATPRERVTLTCTVNPDVLCLGNRQFKKFSTCNWTSGHRWSTAMLLSITLGGFGVDRFYLGHWEVGLGKLFSFGGAGVWTLVDVILIGIGYVKPADGSLYIF
ncbi:TM2 domain-containing protein 3-like [Oscarella lobularis]|uniref:TM2 domain-containing protein 3-like n=1 Tax=Oscarella lobularis TaxID=121494 RepID=UPI0033131DE9